MIHVDQYFGRISGLRGDFGGLPTWARVLVALAALPGIVLLALSILVFVVSLSALLLLTAPVYAALKRLTDRPAGSEERVVSPGVKRVDVTVIE